MDCPTCSEGLTAYLDGELGFAERESIRKHLDACPRCREEHRSSLYASRLVDRLPQIHPDPDLWRGISDQIGRNDWSLNHLQSLLFGRWSPAMAAAGLGALLLGLSFFLPADERPHPEAEHLLNSFLQERQQLDRVRTVSFEEEPEGIVDPPLYPNPFAEPQLDRTRNPFASE